MVHDIVFLILGLGLTLVGANFLTDGASAVARRLRMSELTIGMTVVAFGSCTPDLVISLTSTLQNKAAMAVGDIVGANIFNLLLIIGVCALIRPIVIGKETLQKEFPMVVLSALILFFMACDTVIDGTAIDMLNRSDGLVLLCFFAINCYVTYKIAKSPDTSTESAGNSAPPARPIKTWLACGMILAGLAGLVFGGNWFVNSASGIAEKAGMSESLVGLTVVAIGSSLPDLFTSAVAAAKGHSGIALGNVVGSCVLNVFFIIGICATTRPLQLGTINWVDLAVPVAASLLLWLFGWVWGNRTIKRAEGAIMVLAYGAYIAYLILSSK